MSAVAKVGTIAHFLVLPGHTVILKGIISGGITGIRTTARSEIKLIAHPNHRVPYTFKGRFWRSVGIQKVVGYPRNSRFKEHPKFWHRAETDSESHWQRKGTTIARRFDDRAIGSNVRRWETMKNLSRHRMSERGSESIDSETDFRIQRPIGAEIGHCQHIQRVGKHHLRIP